jgi:hypothetical protein
MTTNGAWVDGVFYDGIAVTAADLNANNQWLLAQAGSGAPPSASPNQVFAGPASGSAGPAAFRALVAADIPGGGGGGGITSIALNAPPEFAVGGSPVVTPGGTLTMTKTNQPANAVWAGPVGGVGGPPSFRPLVTADLPAGGGGGITSISLSAPADFIVTGSPVSPPSGVLGLSYANQAPHAFLGGPATGSATTPTYRLLAASDVPTLPYVASVALTASPEFTVSGSPVGPGTGTLGFTAAPQAQHTVWAGPLSGTGAPGFRLLAASDIPALSYLSSLTLTMPSFLSVAGSPATGAGVLTVTLATQSANLVFAGPTTGTAAAPTFRPLTLADMPGGFGTGTVTQVGLALPSIFTVTNSPVNTTGTLTGTLNTQSAGLVFAGPATGVPAAPTFRALSASDIPALPYGSVTQVAMTVPPEFVVGGSPINGSGTLAVTKSTQAANTVWAGPLSGGSVAPTFRALVGADLPLPSATTLGGVQSIAAVAHNFLTGISITGIPSASQPAFTDILGTATAGQGGTGAANLTAHGMVIAEGASPMVTIPPGAGGQLVISQGAAVDPAFKAMSGDATISAAGAITVTTIGGVALGTFAFQNYATPPAIGGTTPNTLAGTTLSLIKTTSANPATVFLNRPEATLGNAQPLGQMLFTGNNAAGTLFTWAGIQGVARISTAGAEEGALQFQTNHPGQTTLTTDFTIDNGFLYAQIAGNNIKLADNQGNLYASYLGGGVAAANQASITLQRLSNLAGGAFIGQMVWSAPNNAATIGPWAAIFAQARAVAPGSEEGGILFQTSHPGSFGTLTTDLFIDNGTIYVGPGGTVLTGIKIADASGNLFGATVNATTNGSVAAPSLTVGSTLVGMYGNAGNNLLGFTNGAASTLPVNLVGNSSLVFGSTAAVRVGAANSNLAALQILGGTTYAGLNISRWDNSNTGNTLAIGKSRSTTVGTPGGAVTSGTNIGAISFVGDDGTTMNTIAANIFVQCNGAVSTGVIPTAMVFTTQQGANDFCISAGSFYQGGSTAGKLLFDGVFNYGGPAPSFQRLASTTGFNVTATSTFSGIQFTPAGTLATGTLNMPATPVDQQEWTVASSQTITALTMSGNGNTLLGPLTTLTANGFAKWKYIAATTTWYRIG